MGSFINNLIDRSSESAQSIQPRLKGKFERDLTSPDFFTGINETTFDAREPAETQDKQFPIDRRATTVRLSLFKNVIDEATENIGQSRVSKALQRNTPQIKDNIAPEKTPRFEQPCELLPPQNIYEDTSAERQGDNKDYVQRNPNTKISTDELHSDGRQQQIKPQSASNTPSKTADTKKIYKSQPVVNAATDLMAPVEIPAKANTKQPGPSFRQQKTSAVGHAQTVNISIGRIEVRVSQSSAQSPLKTKNKGVAIMSLDEYLRKRNQGS